MPETVELRSLVEQSLRGARTIVADNGAARNATTGSKPPMSLLPGIPTQLTYVLVHEAAHAVMAVYFFGP